MCVWVGFTFGVLWIAVTSNRYTVLMHLGSQIIEKPLTNIYKMGFTLDLFEVSLIILMWLFWKERKIYGVWG